MSPLQVTATLALLLACVHLSVGGPLPADNPVYRITSKEAVYTLGLVRTYLQQGYNGVFNNPRSLDNLVCANIDLPCLRNVSGCNSTATSVATNFYYLSFAYSYVLGLSQENSSIAERELVHLDFMEMLFSRLSVQWERYWQTYHRVCSDDTCITYQGIVDKASIPDNVTALQQSGGYTHLELAKVIICHLRVVIRDMVYVIGYDSSRPVYRFCHNLPTLQKICNSHRFKDDDIFS